VVQGQVLQRSWNVVGSSSCGLCQGQQCMLSCAIVWAEVVVCYLFVCCWVSLVRCAMVPAQVKAVREEAARREAALQAQIDEARSAAAAAAGGGPGGDGGDLASLLAAREAELENLQAALGELSYEVTERIGA
jgi:hypothetical protein